MKIAFLFLALRSRGASPFAPRICCSSFLPPVLPRPANGQAEAFSVPVESTRRRRLGFMVAWEGASGREGKRAESQGCQARAALAALAVVCAGGRQK